MFSVMLMARRRQWATAAGTARLHDRLLRLRLHDVAQAAHAAEHRDRRRRWRASADDRLGRRHWRCQLRLAWSLVPADLPVDTAALLGAVAVPPAATTPSAPGADDIRSWPAQRATKQARSWATHLTLLAPIAPGAWVMLDRSYATAGVYGAGFAIALWPPSLAAPSRSARTPGRPVILRPRRLFAYSLLYLFASVRRGGGEARRLWSSIAPHEA